MTKTCTTCPYCGVGCGVIAETQDDQVTISGDPDHPANFGRLCSKGSALAETIGPEDRLLYPEVHGKRSDWDLALGLVADQFKRAIETHGPDAVAFYVSGQILTEDYYVANKLMKGFIGTANIDTNSRLCMASSVVGHKRAFGSDTVTGLYADFEAADQIVLVGSNLAWCHPVLFQRIMAEKEKRPDLRLIVIDPRRTRTADVADMWLPILSDGDAALFNAVLVHLQDAGFVDWDYVSKYVSGFDEALAAAKSDLPHAEVKTGLTNELLNRFSRSFIERPKTVTIYSQGVNQSQHGTDKVNAILNCHLATGRIGKKGMGPFSITGQPNAMGGREVGGLATMLAAHMDLDNPDHQATVQEFWGSPRIANKVGLKAVDMFDAVKSGRIKAIWIMGTNPVDSLPMAGAVEDALKSCPFVVVSDVVAHTDSLRHADVKLPSLAWGEKTGTVTNSERRISRQRGFLRAPGAAKADWWQLTRVAKRMGFQDAFSFPNVAAVFREHAALSGFKNDGQRDFDISAYADISDADYETMQPFIWPQPQSGHAKKRFFKDGGFYTPDTKARMLPIQAPMPVEAKPNSFVLNSGRVRDHWHTMTRTGRSQTNSTHLAEPFCEIHPGDAADLGIEPASLVKLSANGCDVIVRALLTDRQRRGEVFVPIHWTDQFASSARIGQLVSADRDPFSGQPALKMSSVSVARYRAKTFGFFIATNAPKFATEPDYWALAKTDLGWRVEVAFKNALSINEVAEALHIRRQADLSVHASTSLDGSRVWLDGDVLTAGLWVARQPVALSRSLVVAALGRPLTDGLAMQLLSGRASVGAPDKGAIICACEQVGAIEIRDAVRNGANDIHAIGKACGAGTNCGSCRSELKAFLDEAIPIAAE
ncbi:MAG: nitrate reductase [Pseudomonadota bacterium]